MLHGIHVSSPVGVLYLEADELGLTRVLFDGETHPGPDRESPILAQAKAWLEVYFSGRDPGPLPPLHPVGTPFRQQVWRLLLEIPYGKTTTYGALAKELERIQGKRASARAVGGAVGHNPIPIFIPCHRVVGADGSLTGFSGGMEKKILLLGVERK